MTLRPLLSRAVIPERTWSLLLDLAVFAALLAGIEGLLVITRYWFSAVTPAAHISRSPSALPLYAFYSVVRIAVAYVLSLLFALVYGYVAAYNRRLEGLMVAVLDILQSIPVLSFLPSVMLAMVALFPNWQLGVEFGAIVLIFTGQVWNMAFSFYASLKSIPRELREAAQIYGFGKWQRFVELELPYGAIGLVWNSMVSVAGGWFFLMVCEMFVLQKRDFRLPGLGSYLQMATDAGDTVSIFWGLGVMIGVILLIDQLVWRPAIAWSDKFKFEQVEATAQPTSAVLNLLRRSNLLARFRLAVMAPVSERLSLRLAQSSAVVESTPADAPPWKTVAAMVAGALLGGVILYALYSAASTLKTLTVAELLSTLKGAAAKLGARVGIARDLRPLDDSRGSGHRFQPQAGAHRAALCAGSGVGAGHRAVSGHPAGADPRRRRAGGGIDPVDAARHAMVRPVQCDCGRHGHPLGSAGSSGCFPLPEIGPLAHRHSARDFSLPDHGHGDGVGRRLERQHCR